MVIGDPVKDTDHPSPGERDNPDPAPNPGREIQISVIPKQQTGPMGGVTSHCKTHTLTQVLGEIQIDPLTASFPQIFDLLK